MPNYLTSATKTYFVGLLVGLAHIVSGVAGLADPVAFYATSLAGFYHTIAWLGLKEVTGWVLIAAGATAVFASSDWLWWGHKRRVLLFAPQQILLLLQIISTGMALTLGVYPDGYIPKGGGWFILADQVWALILALSHSLWLAGLLYGRVYSGDYN